MTKHLLPRAGACRRLLQAGAVLFALSAASGTWAQEFLANKKFTDSSGNSQTAINANSSTTLRFDLYNSTAGTLTSTVKDTLPTTVPADQLWFDTNVTTPTLLAGARPGCTTGTAVYTDIISPGKARTVTITSAVGPKPAGSTAANCQVTLPVHYGGVGTSGNVINTVAAGDATATDGTSIFPSEAFSATLGLIAPVNPLAVAKSFSPALIVGGGSSTLTLTVRNTTSPAVNPMNGVGFTDTLPGTMTATGPATFSAGCGSPTTSTASGSTTVDMSGASLPPYNAGNAAATTCTITVPVTATGNGALLNSIPAGGVGNGTYSNVVAGQGTLNVRSTVKMTKTINGRTDTPLPVPANLYGTTFNTGPNSSVVGQPVLVRVYFSNPTSAPLTGGNLTDVLPSNGNGNVVAVGGTAGGNCAWTPPTITAGATTVTLSGFTVPAATGNTPGTCYVEFYVKGTTTMTNNPNALSSSNISFDGNPTVETATQASMTVNAAAGGPGGVGAVTASKQFVKSGGSLQTGVMDANIVRVQKNEKFWMRVAVNNLIYDTTYTGGSVTDTLPAGLVVATPVNVRLLQNPPYGANANNTYAQGCGNGDATAGNDATDGTVTAVAGGNTITYSGFTVLSGAGVNNVTAKNQGCFYSIELVGDPAYTSGGDFINTIGSNTVSTTQGATNPAGVSARAAVMSDMDTTKAFNPSSIATGGGAKTRLTITFTNKSIAGPITGLSVTDPLPSSAGFGTLLVANPPNAATTCGGSFAPAAADNSVSLSGGTVPAATSSTVPGVCTISVDVVHSGGTGATNTITNTIAAGQVHNDQGQTNPLPVTATLSRSTTGVSVIKSFVNTDGSALSSPPFGGQPVRLRIDFAATSGSVAQDMISVVDNMPAGMVVAPTPSVATTCVKNDGTTLADVTATAGQVGIAGFYFGAYVNGATVPTDACRLEVNVVLTTTGNKTNTISANAVTTSVGSTNATATSASVTAQANTVVQKAFNPKSIEVGATSTLTITIVNVNSSARTDFTLTDTFPTGLVAAGAASTNCGNGVATVAAGGTSVSITGGDVVANGQCTITVPVTSTKAATYHNDIATCTNCTGYLDLSQAHDDVEVFASSLRGTVFIDPDLNGGTTGYQPAGDTGLGGVAVALLKDGNVVATATTAPAPVAAGGTFTNIVGGNPVTCTLPAGVSLEVGQYYFCNLVSGSGYEVRETQPASYTSTGNHQGSAGGTPGTLGGGTELISGITIRPKTDEDKYDFGEYHYGVPGATFVSGRVYEERGGNTTDGGNATDPGLVTTVSITCTGPLAQTPAYSASMTTNADGTYRFDGMLPGAQCTITETQPTNYSNAYVRPGESGEPGVVGTPDSAQYGSHATTTVISNIVVPAAGSPLNDFAEVQLSDMTSTTVCTPKSGPPGTAVSCVVTCTNNGPDPARNASCWVLNGPTLPGAPAPTCPGSPASSLAVGSSLSCTVNFNLPNTPGDIPVQGGAAADNDSNGGNVPANGNNPSNDKVAPQLSDMTSTTVCTPKSGTPGTAVSCVVTCTNNGPDPASNASCWVLNALTLPGAPAPTCPGSPASTLAVGGTLSCTVNFNLPNTLGDIPVQGGAAASNDINGGNVPANGNNPSSDKVATYLPEPVPTLSQWGLVLLSLLLAGVALRRRRM